MCNRLMRVIHYGHVHNNLTTFGPATDLRMNLNSLDQENIQELYHHSDDRIEIQMKTLFQIKKN